jgi:hypothetical protein
MAIRLIPTALGPTLSLGLSEKRDREGNQKSNTQGVPQWTVSVFSTALRESANVTVAAVTRPEMPADGHPVELVGLHAGTYALDGRASFYFTADGVQAVKHV